MKTTISNIEETTMDGNDRTLYIDGISKTGFLIPPHFAGTGESGMTYSYFSDSFII